MPAQELQTLSSHHYRIMDYMLAGWKLTEIAKAMNCTTQNLQYVKKSRIFQDELAIKRSILDSQVNEKLANSVSSNTEYINEKLASGARDAIDKLCGFVSGSEECSPSISRQSASDILDRAGYPKLTKTENTNNTIFVLDTDDLDRIEKTIEMDVDREPKMLEKSETVIDVEFESEPTTV
jgi:septum formation inhibitor MinC